jgi:hypothetical protein
MTPLDRDRLAKVLAMLASPHPGEALAAAQTALKFLHAEGLTWNELLATRDDLNRSDKLLAKVEVLEASNKRLRVSNKRLRDLNKRLRLENRLSRMRAAWAHPSGALRALALWIIFVCGIGLFIFLCLD